MAHKTFSQEQFMVRYYKLNLTFQTSVPSNFLGEALQVRDTPSKRQDCLLSLNEAIYFTFWLRSRTPILSTNMLMLHSYRLYFLSQDPTYFLLP